MSLRPILIHQNKKSQRELLKEIVGNFTRREIFLVSNFEECVEVTNRNNFFIVYIDLEADDKDQLNWLEDYNGTVVGAVSRRWPEKQLKHFVSSGLDDYIFKPYQPERIEQQVINRDKYVQGRL